MEFIKGKWYKFRDGEGFRYARNYREPDEYCYFDQYFYPYRQEKVQKYLGNWRSSDCLGLATEEELRSILSENHEDYPRKKELFLI